MASKLVYSVVAVAGIAAASGAAWWYQSRPQGPKEIAATGSAGAPAPAGRAAAGPGGATGGGGGALAGVEVARVSPALVRDDAQSVGSLRSRQSVVLRPEVAGRIATLGFADGARVRRGDVLVQLDDALQRAELKQAEAQVSIASANYKRNQELLAQNFVAQRVVDESAAALLVVQAQQSLACARLERMRIVAPFGGVVGIRSVNIGDYVKDGADLVNLEDLSSMYLDFRLPERYFTRLRAGQEVEVQLDAFPGRLFKAKVEAIDPQIDANGRSILVRAVLPNTGGEPMAARGGAGAGGPGTGPRPGAAGAGSVAAGAKPSATTSSAAKPEAPRRLVNQALRKDRAAAPEAATTGALTSTQAAPSPCVNTAPGATPMVAAAQANVAPNAVPNAAPSARGAAAAGAPRQGGGQSAGLGSGQASGQGSGLGSGPLRPGMFARVTAVFAVKENALMVPEEAIVPQGGRQFVIKVVELTPEQVAAAKQAAQQAAQAAAQAASAGSAAASAGAGPGATPGATPGAAPGAAPARAGGPGGGGPGAAPAVPQAGADGRYLVSKRTEVKLGIRRPGQVELLDGVTEGETVVVAGQQRLQRDGTSLRIVDVPRGGGGSGAAANAAPVASAPAAPASR